MIAVDAMGGDYAPEAIVAGALKVARQGMALTLCGPKDHLERLLNSQDSSWQQHAITIEDAQSVIDMGEDPVKAVRRKSDSSLVQAVTLVKQGRACAVVSAGNSGALMTAATFLLGRKSGVDRPAIAAFLPSRKGKVLCLDLGANTDCKPQYLVHFARLGACYMRQTLGIEGPRVGILANGSEPGKGSLLVKQASLLLAQESQLNFVGNIEPSALVDHEVDVLVTDGFSGNILLKSFEAAASLFELSSDSHSARVMHMQGGALLLGVNGTVVVAHGCAKEDSIAQALHLAAGAATTESKYIVRRTYETGQSDHASCS